LMLAIIGGQPERFAGHVELYFRALEQFGHPRLAVGQHALGLVADTDQEAAETWWQSWKPAVEHLAAERGFYAPSRERYDMELATGALFVGSPETVAQKIARMVDVLQISRFDLKYDLPGLPRAARAQTIELLGTTVLPRVHEILAETASKVAMDNLVLAPESGR
jgi:alkanesulfonate monooxygenase SsuD/methylene tetrahydromethanopterin reductase-like flavin-dependent oxidoreductase (luciferase family)